MPLAMLSPLVSMALLLRLGVERHEVAGRGRGHPLLDREAQPRLGLLVGFGRLGQAQQRARIEQVDGGGKGGHRVGGPGVRGEALVAGGRVGLQALVPQLGRFLEIGLLQGLQLLGGKTQLGHGRHGGAAAQAAKGLHRLGPVLDRGFAGTAGRPRSSLLQNSSCLLIPCCSGVNSRSIPSIMLHCNITHALPMYLIVIAWLYVALMMAVAEATRTHGHGGRRLLHLCTLWRASCVTGGLPDRNAGAKKSDQGARSSRVGAARGCRVTGARCWRRSGR